MTEKYFRVTLRQDAWQNHEAVLSSKEHGVLSKEEAAEAVLEQWKGRRNDIRLINVGSSGFDEADCDAEDVEEIDKENYEASLAAYAKPTAHPAMTLDEAKEQFDAAPSCATAAAYLQKLVTYNANDMISDDTLYSGIASVRVWLEQQG